MLDDQTGQPPRTGPTGLAVLLGCLGLVAGLARAQAPPRQVSKVYPDTSHTAEALLKNAENHARGGQYAEAIEMYQRVIAQFGDKVVLVPPIVKAGGPQAPATGVVEPDDSMLYVDARLDCQRRIAALPPEGRALYRDRVDAQAERWFKAGASSRDRAGLRRVIDQAFCSSWGDDALELLGDLSFQEGLFAEAMGSYRRLVPDGMAGGSGGGMAHPDPSVDLARVAAKALLCRAAMGDAPSSADLAAFAKRYPDAKGDLAGRSGPLAKVVADAIGEDRLAAPTPPDGRWPTFAGDPTRTKVAPGSVDVGSLQWRVELAPIQPSSTRPPYLGRRNSMTYPSATISPDRLLAYHPIVVGEQVVVADERSVTAYNLNQRPGEGGAGASAVVAWKHEYQPASVSEAARIYQGLPRYTLTAFGDRIFARMGPPPSVGFNGQGRGGGNMVGGGGGNSAIVALDRASDGKLLWRRPATEVPLPGRNPDGTPRYATFDGTPVADGRNVYVALTDRVQQTSTYVACLDAETGNPRWIRYVCAASSDADPFSGALAGEINHRLLTLDGPTLYYQTDLGAVVALDIESGDVRWLATYPWQGRNGPGSGNERDLNPAVVAGGLVVVAPSDANALFAFDAATGRLAWKTRALPEEVKLSHVLGVIKGRVVASGDRVLLFDLKTGVLVQTWPDGSQGPQGYGRGILAGDRIYWPTRSEIHVLDADGFRAQPSIKLETFGATGGNLAVGDGFLAVAGAEGLVVFCQNRRLIERYKEEIAKAPDRASNYYRMAQAAEASGMDDVALVGFEDVIRLARPSETIDGHSLVESARDHQHRLLMKGGDSARKAGDWPAAVARFARAGEAARSDRDRLSARLDLADAQLKGGEAAVAVATLQRLLADEGARPLVVAAGDGLRSVRADLLIADRLAAIVRGEGRGAYAEFDRAAVALLDRGLKANDPRLIADVGRSFPAASVVPEAWLALGRHHDGQNQPREAARAYKRLLATPEAGPSARARGLIGLARAFEARRLWAPAREAYLLAATRHGDEAVEGESVAKVAEVVADRLRRAPFDRLSGETGPPTTPAPLARRWGRQWPATLRPIGAEGVPPSPEQGRVFLAEGPTLRAVDPGTGAPGWSANLGGDPVWVGYLADRLVAATRTRLVSLDLAKGTVDWSHDLATAPTGPGANKAGGDPFAGAGGVDRDRESASPPAQFVDFRVVGGRVICLRGDRGLVAFDGESGQVDWSFGPATGRINPRMLVGPDRIVLQVRKPNSVLVLDTATGRRRGEFPQGEEEEWPRDPLAIDDDHVALITDRMTVALFDLNRGVNAWAFRESKGMPKYGPPRLLGDAERLLVVHNGIDLIRLDPSTGRKTWSRPLGDKDLSERPDATALAGDGFYYASGDDLVALSVGDGSVAWRRKLIGPTSGWSLALTDRFVAAYPNPAHLVEDDLPALPVVFRRRDTGAIVQRLLLPTPVTDLTLKLAPRGAFVATQGGLWAFGDRPEPVAAVKP